MRDGRRTLVHFARALDPEAARILGDLIAWTDDLGEQGDVLEGLASHWPELQAAFRKAQRVAKKAARREELAAECEVCGRTTAGTGSDRIRRGSGHPLCDSCNHSWTRARQRGLDFSEWRAQRNRRHQPLW